MKVLLIDNMNNNMFTLQRYLLDMGVDAYLCSTSSEFHHFSPEWDTFYYEKYRCRHFKVSWGKAYDFFLKRDYIRQDLSGYDLYIGCGYAPLFLSVIRRNLDVYVPYGSDLYELPFWSKDVYRNRHFPLNLIPDLLIKHFLKKAIKRVRACTFPHIGKGGDALDRLHIHSSQISAPLVYPEVPPETVLDTHEILCRVRHFRAKKDILFINHSRQVWVDIQSSSYKGNDLFFRAISRFKNETRASLGLILCEYGEDVAATKSLLLELGLSDDVLWLPLQPRKIILAFLSMCDLAFDSISPLSVGATSMESLCSGVPVVARYIPPATGRALENSDECPPILNVETEDDVLAVLMDYWKDRNKYSDIGNRSRDWFYRHRGRGLAEKYLAIIRMLYEAKSSLGPL